MAACVANVDQFQFHVYVKYNLIAIAQTPELTSKPYHMLDIVKVIARL